MSQKLKRILALLLVFVSLFQLTACDVEDIKDELKDYVADAIGDAVDDAVGDVKDQVSQAGENAISGITSLLPGGNDDEDNEDDEALLEDTIIERVEGNYNPATITTESTNNGDTEENDEKTWFQAASDWLGGEKKRAEEEISATFEAIGSSKWWNALFGKLTVSYHPYGGYNAPNNQFCKSGKKMTITDEKPTRPGYHFVGWTSVYGSQDAEFISGQEILVEDRIDLYACWKKIIPENPKEDENSGAEENRVPENNAEKNAIEHTPNYTIHRQGSNIWITCDCGYTVSEWIDQLPYGGKMTFENFKYYYQNGNVNAALNPKQEQEVLELYTMYKLRDYGIQCLQTLASTQMENLSKSTVEKAINTAEVVTKGTNKILSATDKLTDDKYKDAHAAVANYLNNKPMKDDEKAALESYLEVVNDKAKAAEEFVGYFQMATTLFSAANKLESDNKEKSVDGFIDFVSVCLDLVGKVYNISLLSDYYNAVFSASKEANKRANLIMKALDEYNTAMGTLSLPPEEMNYIADIFHVADTDIAMNLTKKVREETLDQSVYYDSCKPEPFAVIWERMLDNPPPSTGALLVLRVYLIDKLELELRKDLQIEITADSDMERLDQQFRGIHEYLKLVSEYPKEHTYHWNAKPSK